MKPTIRVSLCILLWAVCGFSDAPMRGQQGATRPVLSAPPAASQIPLQQTPGQTAPGQTAPGQTAPGQPTPGQPGMAVAVGPEYVLGTEDAIMVTVWREPTLTGQLVVRPDGMISLPLLGDLRAAGLTPVALSQVIAERLKKYINDPLVTVTVTGDSSQRIYFIGEVQRPGPTALTPEMTVLQAISSAGGLTPYANAKHIYILRGAKGTQQKIPFDYKKALKQGNEQGIVLNPGDTIVVP